METKLAHICRAENAKRKLYLPPVNSCNERRYLRDNQRPVYRPSFETWIFIGVSLAIKVGAVALYFFLKP